jgi:hypothetical protein
MDFKEVVGRIRKKKNQFKESWAKSHAAKQKEFDEGYGLGIREVGWTPKFFKKATKKIFGLKE